jgi:hypothetical protein
MLRNEAKNEGLPRAVIGRLRAPRLISQHWFCCGWACWLLATAIWDYHLRESCSCLPGCGAMAATGVALADLAPKAAGLGHLRLAKRPVLALLASRCRLAETRCKGRAMAACSRPCAAWKEAVSAPFAWPLLYLKRLRCYLGGHVCQVCKEHRLG